MSRPGFAAVLLLALVAVPRAVPGAAEPERGTAAALYSRAEKAFSALKADARAQRQRGNFMRVLEDYRRVFEKHATTRQAERALLRAGELHTLLYRWTGQEGDLNRAQHYYQRLLQNYPGSPLLPDAQLAIAYLYLDHFKDPAQAWLKFRDVTALARGGEAVAEAKRQLRRLARYAPPPSPDPAPAPEAEPPCPTPAPPAAAAAADAPAPKAGPASAMPTVLNRVRDVRHWSNPEYSRVVIDLDAPTNFYSNLLEDRSGSGKPPRLYVDLFNSLVEERFCRPIAVNDGILLGVRAGQFTPESVRVVLDIDRLRTYRVFPMQNPFRIVIDVTGGSAPAAPPAAGSGAALASVAGAVPAAQAPGAAARALSVPPAAPIVPEPVPELLPLPPLVAGPGAPPADRGAPGSADTAPRQSGSLSRASAPVPVLAPAPVPVLAAAPAPVPHTLSAAPPGPARGGERARVPSPPPPAGKLSLARQLGLGVRRVVIDAGHGAHDPGAIGVGGLQEKDVTLDLALRVRDVLQAAGYDTVLTRDRDVYLPLEERTALANTARGDLFLSLHCNSSDSGNLNGVETYYLNLASSRRAMATAARENSMALANMSDLQDLLKEIYNSKMDESSRFAEAVQRAMHGSLRRRYRDVKDLGVKQAPFYVLIGAQMPSILAEVSFINHAAEGRRLSDPAYRQLIAQAIADGVRRYVKTVKTAAADAPRETTP